ncbi:hypothetical protein ACJX0J_012583, partial [Zea mays]
MIYAIILFHLYALARGFSSMLGKFIEILDHTPHDYIMIKNNRTYAITLDHYCTTAKIVTTLECHIMILPILQKNKKRDQNWKIKLERLGNLYRVEATSTQGLPQFLRQTFYALWTCTNVYNY